MVAISVLSTLAVGLVFGSLNTATVSLNLAFTQIELSLALLLAAFFVAGVMLGALWMLVTGVLPARIKANRSRKAMRSPDHNQGHHV